MGLKIIHFLIQELETFDNPAATFMKSSDSAIRQQYHFRGQTSPLSTKVCKFGNGRGRKGSGLWILIKFRLSYKRTLCFCLIPILFSFTKAFKWL
jgi:hypothetical protein